MAQSRAQKRRKKDSPKPGFSMEKLKVWWEQFWDGKSPILKFLLLFLLIIIPFYLIWYTDFFGTDILAPWNEFNAGLSSGILNLFGLETTATGANIIGPTTSIAIKEGCDAIEPVILLVAGIGAFPSPWLAKLKGMLWGTLFLLSMNLVRILSLYWVALSWPEAFEFFHIDFWQVLFIFLALLSWGYWLRKVSRNNISEHEEA